MPKVVVFRPIDVPLLATLARRADEAGALHHVAHFVYPNAAAEHARELWAAAEPETAAELVAGMLAVDGAAVELFRHLLDVSDGETLRSGFHGGLTPAEATAALSRGGFEVVAPGTVDEASLSRIGAMSLERLFDAGVLDAATVAATWLIRLAGGAPTTFVDPATPSEATPTTAEGAAPVAASRPLHSLAGPMRVMRGGGVDPSGGGPGVAETTVFLQDAVVTETRLLRPTDVAWSGGGSRVLVVADQVRILRRTERATNTFVEGIASRVCFEPLRDTPLPRKRAKDSDNVVMSARFDARGRLATGWRHGELRLGASATDPAQHELIARFDEPVFRIGFAPVGRAVALIVGTDLVLLADGRTPRKLGPAWMARDTGRTPNAGRMVADGVGAHLAWTPDGERVAVCCDGDLRVYDAAGNKLASCHVAAGYGTHGGVGASERGFFVLRAKSLSWWTPEGTLREIPRAVTPREGDLPGRAEVAPGGRAIVTWTMSDDDTPQRHADLEVFDLDRGAAHHLQRRAWNDPVPLTAIAPTGDVIATANGLTLGLAPWTLEHERDEAADALCLGRALRSKGHLEEARRVLGSVVTRRPSLGLALRAELDRIAQDARDAAPAQPARPMSSPRAAPPTDGDLDVDHVVTHARFGRGVVVDVTGRGSAARITVDFSGTERALPASSLRRVGDEGAEPGGS